MKPEKQPKIPQEDLFRMRLENMLDINHEFTTMTKWRNRPGKSGSEKLLIETIKAGLKSKTIKPGSLKKVTVDTTVQEKNIAFPTDSKLLNKVRVNCARTIIGLGRNMY